MTTYPDFPKDFYLYIVFGSRIRGDPHTARQQREVTTNSLRYLHIQQTFRDISSGVESTSFQRYDLKLHIKTDHADVVELLHAKHLTGKLVRWYCMLQDFKPSFSYLPGKANIVANSLSRYIGTFHISRGEDFKSELLQAQRQDQFCAPLICYLESSNDTHVPCIPVPLSKFDLLDDILVFTTFLQAKHELDRV